MDIPKIPTSTYVVRKPFRACFVLSCPDWAEFLAMLEGKIGKGPFLRVQSDELTVWEVSLKSLYRLLMVQCFLPGWHFSEAHPACAVQSQFDQILSSGFPAILSINKIRMKIFRIISTHYFWISRLNVRYKMYHISKYNKALSYAVLVPDKKCVYQIPC